MRAVVELEAGQLAGRILVGVGRAAVLAAHQVDFDEGQGEALLGEEHADGARIGPEPVVQLHDRTSFDGVKSAV